jgi:hypothetical protein
MCLDKLENKSNELFFFIQLKHSIDSLSENLLHPETNYKRAVEGRNLRSSVMKSFESVLRLANRFAINAHGFMNLAATVSCILRLICSIL